MSAFRLRMLACMLLVCSLLAGCAEKKVDPELKAALTKSETQYILSTRLPHGALGMYRAKDGKNVVNPYFSCLSALALVEAGHTVEVRNYLDWHFRHLNTEEPDVNGLLYTIYDYRIHLERGVETEEYHKEEYDSADSYAAVLLILTEAYYRATKDTVYLQKKADLLIGVMEMMLDGIRDGLSLTKPSYAVWYMMDNCEVYDGMRAAIVLLEDVLDGVNTAGGTDAGELADRMHQARNELQDAMESLLYQQESGFYAYARWPGSEPGAFKPDRFYPDATAQLMPIVYGLLEPESERAVRLYQWFCEHYRWETLGHMESEEAATYWGVLAYCACLMNDTERVEAYLRSYQKKAGAKHSYPLHNADAAWVLRACLLE